VRLGSNVGRPGIFSGPARRLAKLFRSGSSPACKESLVFTATRSTVADAPLSPRTTGYVGNGAHDLSVYRMSSKAGQRLRAHLTEFCHSLA
jgi:hypothetical protein